MAAPHSLENTLRVHDQAIDAWLGQIRVDYRVVDEEGTVLLDRPQSPIIRVFAAPQRAFAAVADQLVHNGWINGTTAEEMRTNAEKWYNFPLPILSIYRDVPTLDPELSNVPATMRGRVFDPLTGKFRDMPYPGHYRTNYRVTLWSIKRYTDNFFMEWLFSEFGKIGAGSGEAFIPVYHEAPIGVRKQALRYDGAADMSQLEGDGAREIRVEHNFSLRTWHFRALEDGGHPITRVTASGEGLDFDVYQNLFDRPVGYANPKANNSVVTVHASNDYSVTMQSDGYADLTTTPVVLDGDGDAVFSVAFSQDSDVTADFHLAGYDADPLVDSWFASGGIVITPVNGRPVHRFFVVNRELVAFSLAARPLFPGTVRLRRLDVRQMHTETRVLPSASNPGPESVAYAFTGLRVGQPYVAVVVPAAGAADADVIVEDSIYTSSFQKTVPYYADDQIGVAVLIQSKDTTINLVVPNALPAARVYLIPFDAPYQGDA